MDFAPRMVECAEQEAREQGPHVRFSVGDAARPPVTGTFDVVLGRHVLWALPDATAALDCWMALLKPGGWLVLIEGLWHTGAGP